MILGISSLYDMVPHMKVFDDYSHNSYQKALNSESIPNMHHIIKTYKMTHG